MILEEGALFEVTRCLWCLCHRELFRPHSGRHGCVLNLKRAGVDPDQGCIHVCMTRHFWDTVYGLEDAVRVGEEVTGLVVGSSTRRAL